MKALMNASMLASSRGMEGMYSKVGRRNALAGGGGGEESVVVVGDGEARVGGIDEFVRRTLWKGCLGHKRAFGQQGVVWCCIASHSIVLEYSIIYKCPILRK